MMGRYRQIHMLLTGLLLVPLLTGCGAADRQKTENLTDVCGGRGPCFDVELEGQGTVTFTSYAPDPEQDEMADVWFALERDGEIQYQFPFVMAGNRRPQQSFVRVRDVGILDYDQDGNKDVIILTEYKPLTGPDRKENVMRVRLYRNRPEDRMFVLDTERMDMLNRNQWNHTMDEVTAHMGDVEYRLLLKYLTDAIEDGAEDLF